MRSPSLGLVVVRSGSLPGALSLRLDEFDRSGLSVRRALVTADFQAGDNVVLRLADQPEPAVVTIEVWHEEGGWCARIQGDTDDVDWCVSREAAIEEARDAAFYAAVGDEHFANGIRFLVVDRQETTPAGGAT